MFAILDITIEEKGVRGVSSSWSVTPNIVSSTFCSNVLACLASLFAVSFSLRVQFHAPLSLAVSSAGALPSRFLLQTPTLLLLAGPGASLPFCTCFIVEFSAIADASLTTGFHWVQQFVRRTSCTAMHRGTVHRLQRYLDWCVAYCGQLRSVEHGPQYRIPDVDV